MTIQEQIQNEIQSTVPAMIEDAVTTHIHNGSDSAQLQGQYLSQAPQNAVSAPTGGITVDAQARQAINDLISRLQALGFLI